MIVPDDTPQEILDKLNEPAVKQGDLIYWNLEAIDIAKNEPLNPILLEVVKIETSLDGTKIVWMRKKT